jgi:hypothetical protein
MTAARDIQGLKHTHAARQEMQKTRRTYLDDEHEYAFVIGGEPNGEKSKMLGSKAKALNKDLKQKFTDAVSAAYPGKTEERFCYWKWIDPNFGKVDYRPVKGYYATKQRTRSEDKCELPKGLTLPQKETK